MIDPEIANLVIKAMVVVALLIIAVGLVTWRVER
jgi:hypothetical protein